MSKIKVNYNVNHFINGQEVVPIGSDIYQIINPSTEEKLNKVILDDVTNLNTAINNSADVYKSWSELAMHKRIQLLIKWYNWIKENQEEFIKLINLENGKPLKDAKAEFIRGLEVLQYAISLQPLSSGNHSKVNQYISIFTLKESLGICAGICPFNFPFMIPMWMIPIAIALGNTFVIKPSEKVPSTVLLLAEGAIKSGIPKGVINVVQGGIKVVNKLIENPKVKTISFVGSTKIGLLIHQLASKYRKKVQCNMGAKNHCVITSNANLETTINNIVGAAFGGAGQRCMALSVAIIVGEDKKFIEKLVEEVNKIDSVKDMGPLINLESKISINKKIDDSLKQDSEIILDRRLQVPKEGFYLGPVLIKTNINSSVYKNELFGPVLSLIQVNSLEEAVKLINYNPYGNGTCLFSDSLHEINYFQNNIEVGQIGINLPIPVPPPQYSWSSSKDSFVGNNYIYGPQSIDFYTKIKTVMIRDDKNKINNSLVMPTN